MLWAAFEVGVGVCPPCFYPFLVEMFLAAALSCPITREFKDPVLPITHCALAIIGGHFLDVGKSEN